MKLTTSTVFRFRSYAEARDFQRRSVDLMGIIHGDDGYFWVVTGRDYGALKRAGYDSPDDEPTAEER
jgi:hypothetical protein